MDALTNCSMDMAFAAILQSCAADIVQHHLQASLVCLTWGILLVFLEVKTCFVCCKSISVLLLGIANSAVYLLDD